MLKITGCALGLVAILAGLPGSAPAADPFKFAVDPSMVSAKIEITATLAYREGRGATFECISFINHAAKTATHVRFTFTYIDAAGSVRGHDTFDRRGSFAPDTNIEGPRDVNQAMHDIGYQNCQSFRFPVDQMAIDRIAVEAVDYDDGTSIKVAPPPAPIEPPAPTPLTTQGRPS